MGSTLRHRRIEHLNYLESSTIKFPPIASVTLAFPSPQRQRSWIKNSQRRKKMKDLQKYLQPSGQRQPRLDLGHLIPVSQLKNNKNMFNCTRKRTVYSSLEQKPIRAFPYRSKEYSDSLTILSSYRVNNIIKVRISKVSRKG